MDGPSVGEMAVIVGSATNERHPFYVPTDRDIVQLAAVDDRDVVGGKIGAVV